MFLLESFSIFEVSWKRKWKLWEGQRPFKHVVTSYALRILRLEEPAVEWDMEHMVPALSSHGDFNGGAARQF